MYFQQTYHWTKFNQIWLVALSQQNHPHHFFFFLKCRFHFLYYYYLYYYCCYFTLLLLFSYIFFTIIIITTFICSWHLIDGHLRCLSKCIYIFLGCGFPHSRGITISRELSPLHSVANIIQSYILLFHVSLHTPHPLSFGLYSQHPNLLIPLQWVILGERGLSDSLF